MEDVGLFFTRPRLLKTSRAVKKSIAAGLVNRKGKEQTYVRLKSSTMTASSRVLTLLILSQILRLNIMAVVMYRFETCVTGREGVKRNNKQQLFF